MCIFQQEQPMSFFFKYQTLVVVVIVVPGYTYSYVLMG